MTISTSPANGWLAVYCGVASENPRIFTQPVVAWATEHNYLVWDDTPTQLTPPRKPGCDETVARFRSGR